MITKDAVEKLVYRRDLVVEFQWNEVADLSCILPSSTIPSDCFGYKNSTMDVCYVH